MSSTGPRLWPLYFLAGGVVLALLLIWLPESLHRQQQVMRTMGIFMLAIFLALLWLFFASRLAWGRRLRYFGGAVLVIALGIGFFRVKGMSGDFAPILEWRWSTEGEATAVEGGDATALNARDWPQFLGPERNNRLRGVHLERDWTRRPPREIWRRPVGAAWSSFAIVGGRAVTQEQHGPDEQVVCYDLATGRKLWQHADSTRYETAIAGVGPRATPTIAGDRVFTLGATGILNCLDLATGALIWSRDILADNQAEAHIWGISCSPLVLDTLVVVSAGGPNERSLVAYHRQNGEFVWGGGTDKAGFSSPRLVTLAGREQILIFNNHSVVAHDPQSGTPLWRQPWDRTECIGQSPALARGPGSGLHRLWHWSQAVSSECRAQRRLDDRYRLEKPPDQGQICQHGLSRRFCLWPRRWGAGLPRPARRQASLEARALRPRPAHPDRRYPSDNERIGVT